MSESLTIECTVHFDRRGRRKELLPGPRPAGPAEPGRVPRVARLMALAIRLDGLVRSGAIESYAEVARLGHMTRARVTQVMNLLALAPDIQEALLFLPRVERGRAPVLLRDLQPIARTPDWAEQRTMWAALRARVAPADQSE
jgi:hypothetical protein